MIDLALVKKPILACVCDVSAVREMGRGLSDHHVVVCKVRLVSAWIKRREGVNGARRIRSGKLREDQYMEGDGRCLANRRIDLG